MPSSGDTFVLVVERCMRYVRSPAQSCRYGYQVDVPGCRGPRLEMSGTCVRYHDQFNCLQEAIRAVLCILSYITDISRRTRPERSLRS